MIRYSATAVLLLLTSSGVFAQTPSPGAPAFDAASVKPNKSNNRDQGMGLPPGRFQATNMSLQDLLEVAFGEAGPPLQMLPDYEIAAGPSWIRTDRFDIAGTASNVPPGAEGLRLRFLMLRTLLADRFKLEVHHEMREVPAYTLVLSNADGKLGAALTPSIVDCQALAAARGRGPVPPPPPGQRPECGIAAAGNGTLWMRGETIAPLANLLSRLTGRPVADRTGLSGPFNVELQFNPAGLAGMDDPGGGNRPAPSNADSPSLYTALQEQLGLKLGATTAPVDVVVIDHVEHPADN